MKLVIFSSNRKEFVRFKMKMGEGGGCRVHQIHLGPTWYWLWTERLTSIFNYDNDQLERPAILIEIHTMKGRKIVLDS